jgi:GNAT superfamily N-acetyltransferase
VSGAHVPLEISLRLARPSELPELVAIDDAAAGLYAQAGLAIDLHPTHPFVKAEVGSWRRALEAQLAHVAVDARDRPLGFITLGHVDGAPYLEQLSVHPRAMRRGIGAALLARAVAWSGVEPIWLTTYAHLEWNRPYYERHGFVVVAERACGPELQRILASQRDVLPRPEMRIAMARAPRDS